jgi:glycolate oxidase FAD binding subunit
MHAVGFRRLGKSVASSFSELRVRIEKIQTVAELGQLVRQAAAGKATLAPRGGGTQDYRLVPPRADSWNVDLRSLNQVIDYPFRDLTITVQAGVTLAQLRQLLAEQGQTLPLDVPFPERATIGGSVAANINGPRRFGWGTWRDYVIGISFVNDRGEETKAGGRVVKNVAGYDLCKLMTGSFGTLGIITQVTLKVRPVLEKRAILSLIVKRDAISPFTERIRGSRLRPMLQIFSQDDKESVVWVGFEDNAAAVDWQIQHLQEQADALHIPSGIVQSGPEFDAVVKRLTHFSETPAVPRFQAAVQPSRLPEILLSADSAAWALQSDVGMGLLAGRWSDDFFQPSHGFQGADKNARASEESRCWFRLAQAVRAADGRIELYRVPADLRALLLPDHPPSPDAWMMRRVKSALDPQGIFQAGRFPPAESSSPSV